MSQGVVVVSHHNFSRNGSVSRRMPVRSQHDIKAAAESSPTGGVDAELSLQTADDEARDTQPIKFALQGRLIKTVRRRLLDHKLA